MAPATFALDGPDFDVALRRCSGESAGIGHVSAVYILDGPRQAITATAATKYVGPRASVFELFRAERRLILHDQPAGLVVLRVHAPINLSGLQGLDIEPQEGTHGRVSALPAVRQTVPIVVHGHGLVSLGEDFAKRDLTVRSLAIFVLQHVYHVHVIPRIEAAEVDDDVVALRDALRR